MCLLTNQIALLGEKDKSSVSNYQKLSALVRHELGGRWVVKGGRVDVPSCSCMLVCMHVLCTVVQESVFRRALPFAVVLE